MSPEVPSNDVVASSAVSKSGHSCDFLVFWGDIVRHARASVIKDSINAGPIFFGGVFGLGSVRTVNTSTQIERATARRAD